MGAADMNKIIFISGPCGSGKTTFSDAYARELAEQTHRTVYVIHGDSFHDGFVEPETGGNFDADGQPVDPVRWEDILAFNWDCLLFAADRALRQRIDVVIDYVIEDELPRVQALAQAHGAALYYIVLTAHTQEIVRRIRQRGDTELIDRALFLKQKLETLPENQGHIYDNTGKPPADAIREIELEKYLMEY